MGDIETRRTHMIRLVNPNDSSQAVNVKVIDEISFTDPSEGNQQYILRLNNHEDGNDKNFRKTHVMTVVGSDGVSTIDVERIDAWGVTLPQDNNQEIGFRMTNNAQEPPVHFKCHDFKIFSHDDPSIWVVMRRIDELQSKDSKERQSNNDSAAPLSMSDNNDPTGGWPNQEKHHRLKRPDDDMDNPTDLDTSDDNTTINPPYRFDPFQDLVDVQWRQEKVGTAIFIFNPNGIEVIVGDSISLTGGWDFVLADDNATNPNSHFAAEITALDAAGYINGGDIGELVATGLVIGPGFPDVDPVSSMFVSAAAAEGAAANTSVEFVPGSNPAQTSFFFSFERITQVDPEFRSAKIYVLADYRVHA